MRTYAAGRQSGKTTLCLNRAAQYVLQGYQVYLVSPTKMRSDVAKSSMKLFYKDDVVSKVNFTYVDRIFTKKLFAGVDKRKNTVVIFDDVDDSLNGLVREVFGSKANVDLVTSTEEVSYKK